MRLDLDDSFDYAVHAALGADGGASFVRRDLLPPNWKLPPLRELGSGLSFDRRGGWLPVRETIPFGVRVGDRIADVRFRSCLEYERSSYTRKDVH